MVEGFFSVAETLPIIVVMSKEIENNILVDVIRFTKSLCEKNGIEVVCPTAIVTITGRICFADEIGTNKVYQLCVQYSTFFLQYHFTFYNIREMSLSEVAIT